MASSLTSDAVGGSGCAVTAQRCSPRGHGRLFSATFLGRSSLSICICPRGQGRVELSVR
jgi:hypothetical protein